MGCGISRVKTGSQISGDTLLPSEKRGAEDARGGTRSVRTFDDPLLRPNHCEDDHHPLERTSVVKPPSIACVDEVPSTSVDDIPDVGLEHPAPGFGSEEPCAQTPHKPEVLHEDARAAQDFIETISPALETNTSSRTAAAAGLSEGPSEDGLPVTKREGECDHPPRTLPNPHHDACDLAALLLSDQPEPLSNSSVRVWVEVIALQGAPFVSNLVKADGLAPLVDAVQTATTSDGERGAAAQELLVVVGEVCSWLQLKLLVNHGVVPALIAVLTRPSSLTVWRKAAAVLHRICGGVDDEMRDALLNPSYIPVLVAQLAGDLHAHPTVGVVQLDNSGEAAITAARNALARVFLTWVSGCKARTSQQRKSVLAGLAQLLRSNNLAILDETCVLLCQLSEGSDRWIQGILDTGAYKQLLRLASEQDQTFSLYALKVISNILMGNEAQTQTIIEADGVEILATILSMPTSNAILHECLCSLSNITAGNWEQIQAVIEHGAVPWLLDHATNTGLPWEVRVEAARVVGNAAANGRRRQVRYLVACGTIEATCTLLAALPERKHSPPNAELADDVTYADKLAGYEAALDVLDSVLRAGNLPKSNSVRPPRNKFAAYLAASASLDAAPSQVCKVALAIVRQVALSGQSSDGLILTKKLRRKAVEILEIVAMVEQSPNQTENQVPQLDHQPTRTSLGVSKDTIATHCSKEPLNTKLANTDAVIAGSMESPSPDIEHDPQADARKVSTHRQFNHSGGKNKSSKKEKRQKTERQDKSQQRRKRPNARTVTSEESTATRPPTIGAKPLGPSADSLDQSIVCLGEFAVITQTTSVATSEQEGPRVPSAGEAWAETRADSGGDHTAALSDPNPADNTRGETTGGGLAPESSPDTGTFTMSADTPPVDARDTSESHDQLERFPPGGASQRVDEIEDVQTAGEGSGTGLNGVRVGDDKSGSVVMHVYSSSLPADDAVGRAHTSCKHVLAEEADAHSGQLESEETRMRESSTGPPSTTPSMPSPRYGGYMGATPKDEDSATSSAAGAPPKPPRPPPIIQPPPPAPRSDSHGRMKIIASRIRSGDPDIMLAGVKALRALFRSEPRATSEAAAFGITADVEQLLQEEGDMEMQLEAARVLIRMAGKSSEGVSQVVRTDVVATLIRLSHQSPAMNLQAQAVLSLANVVGGSCECRAQALEKGALPVVLTVLKQDLPTNMTSSVMRAALSAIYGLMIGTPQPSDEEMVSGLKHLIELLSRGQSIQMHADAMWTLSDIVQAGGTKLAEAAVQVGLIPVLAQHLRHSSSMVAIPVMKVMKTIAHNVHLIPQLLVSDIVHGLKDLATRAQTSTTMTQEACGAVAAIAAGSQCDVTALVDSGNMAALIHQLNTNTHTEVQKECARGISNAATHGREHITRYMVEKGCVDALIRRLDSSNPELISGVLDALTSLLKAGCLKALISKNLFRILKDQLCEHPDSRVSEKASGLCNLASESISEQTDQDT